MRRCVEERQEDGVLSNDLSHTFRALEEAARSLRVLWPIGSSAIPKRCSMVKAQRR